MRYEITTASGSYKQNKQPTITAVYGIESKKKLCICIYYTKYYTHKTTTSDIIKIYVHRPTALIEIARAYMRKQQTIPTAAAAAVCCCCWCCAVWLGFALHCSATKTCKYTFYTKCLFVCLPLYPSA